MRNRFLLLTIFLSGFAFGQNVELIQKFDKGDENTPVFFARNLIPEYKLVKTRKIDSTYGDEIYYTYLPKSTSDEKIKEFLQNNLDNEAIIIAYRAYGSSRSFRSVQGKCNKIMPFWIKEIKPDTKIVAGQRDGFIYKNEEKNIKYYLTATETDYINCSFSRIK